MGRNENRFNRFGFTIRVDIPTQIPEDTNADCHL